MKIAIIILLGLVMGYSNAQQHDHHSEKKTKTTQKTEAGKKFKSTNDLKFRMQKILDLMKKLEDEKSDSKKVADYGVIISDVVQDIIKTCKLDPEADAAIHPTLGLILEGTEDFKKNKSIYRN